MAQFVGRWKIDLNSLKNYDEFAKAAGIPDDLKETYRNTPMTEGFATNGNTWDYDIIREGTAIPSMHYTFTPGVELDTKNAMGKGLRFTFNIESDTRMIMTEFSESMGWKELTITREIKGNAMFATIEVEGTQMLAEYNKC